MSMIIIMIIKNSVSNLVSHSQRKVHRSDPQKASHVLPFCVTWGKQREQRCCSVLVSLHIRSSMKQASLPLSTKLPSDLIWLSALFSSPSWSWISLIFPGVSIQPASWTKGQEAAFFPPRRGRLRWKRQTWTERRKKRKAKEEKPWLKLCWKLMTQE